MKTTHKIDELFHEKLKEASVHEKTSASSWDKISAGLDKQVTKGFLSGSSGLVTMVSTSITILLIATSILYFSTRKESTQLSENASSSDLNASITSNFTSTNLNSSITHNSTSSSLNTPASINSSSNKLNNSIPSNSTSSPINTPISRNSSSSSSYSHFHPSTSLATDALFQSSSLKQTAHGFALSHGIFSSTPGIQASSAFMETRAHSPFSEKQSITSIISELSLASPHLNYFVPDKSIERSNQSFESQGFKQRHRWSWDVSAFAGVQSNTSLYSTQNSEDFSLAEDRTHSIEEISDRTAGVRLSTQYRRFLLETGISYAEQTETERHNLSSFLINNYWEEIYGTHPVSYSDTSWYYQYVNGDTVWIPAIQNYIVQVPDTSLISVSDTTLIHIDTSFYNTHSHFEVPFLAGYLLGQGTFEVYLKAGVIGKYYSLYRGYSTLGPWVKDIYAFDIEKISRFGIDSYVGAEFRYHPGYRIYLFGDLYYRRSLLSRADSYGFTRTEEKYGIRFGLGYYL